VNIDNQSIMTCDIKCIGIEVTVCGDIEKCIPPSPIRIITIVLSTFSGFISMIWLLSGDDVICSITRRLYCFLLIGSILMITALLVTIDPGKIYSMEAYNLMEYLLISITTIYFVILYGLICWKCINNARIIRQNAQRNLQERVSGNNARFIRQNAQRNVQGRVSGQKSIQKESEESRNRRQQPPLP
jgi:hypothetical protein